MSTEPATVDGFLGGRIRARREAAELTRDELARRIRRYGLPFTQGVVAHIENGARTLTIGELVVVCFALGVSVPKLLDGDDEKVQLTPTAIASAKVIASVLSEPELVMPRAAPLEFPEEHMWVWPDATPKALRHAAECAGLEAERKAAAKLNVDAYVVSLAALKTWGECLTTERDLRVERQVAAEGTPGLSDASVTVKRGHVTRALLRELQPALGEECETCGQRTLDAHHITAVMPPLDDYDDGGGGSVTATYCANHCPENCDKEH